jgi:predicted nucleic acid-binding protein
MRVMIDSNIHDKIVLSSNTMERIESAIRSNQLTLISTHIQRDQLLNIPNSKALHREAVLQVPTVINRTSGAIWGVSKWGAATWTTSRDRHVIKGVMTVDGNHSEDALIAASASALADVLVTEDKNLLKRLRKLALDLELWSFAHFCEWLESLQCDE